MKIIRFGTLGKEKPGIFIDGKRLDVSGLVHDFDEEFFSTTNLDEFEKITKDIDLPEVAPEVRWGSPVSRPGKLICIGLNYADHAEESNMQVPEEPIIFLKASSAIIGPYDQVILPKGSKKSDWEVELGVVISKKANYITESEAMNYVAGYVLHNDISEREFQLERGGQWVKGKSCDTFAPLGPWMATANEIPEVDNLRLWLKLNDEIMQEGNTSNLIFKIPYLIAYVSQFMSLMPGDIISTGTPAGVGLGMFPQIFLKPGDVMELGIDGMGMSRQEVVV